jgi:hypothetical protein
VRIGAGLRSVLSPVKGLRLMDAGEVEWRDIPGLAQYEASSDGQIRSKTTKYVRKAKPKLGGYVHLTLKADDGKRVLKYAHVLVALACREPRPRDEALR